MSINIAPSKDTSHQGYVVVAPQASDVISAALQAAFGREDAAPAEFGVLLRQIDLADSGSGRC